VIGLAGWSGAGKTTLVRSLIPALIERGLRVSTIKHAHDDFDIDVPGKDSYEHRAAGACEVLVASRNRYALVHEMHGAPEPSLPELLAHLCAVDLVLIEGFKHAPHPKLEVHRAANGKPWLFPGDAYVRGIIADVAPPHCTLPRVELDDIEAITDLVLRVAAPFPEPTPWRS
jgi:molybdopterin-guanine dinucleotide biosynthesis protein B